MAVNASINNTWSKVESVACFTCLQLSGLHDSDSVFKMINSIIICRYVLISLSLRRGIFLNVLSQYQLNLIIYQVPFLAAALILYVLGLVVYMLICR